MGLAHWRAVLLVSGPRSSARAGQLAHERALEPSLFRVVEVFAPSVRDPQLRLAQQVHKRMKAAFCAKVRIGRLWPVPRGATAGFRERPERSATLASTIASPPIYPELAPAHQERVGAAIRSF